MKKRIITRIFSILLCLVMLSSLFPTAAFAAWEDGMECWFCGHYHWDEYCCGMCGACSAECTSVDCCLLTHCNECGACDTDLNGCPECRMCDDCTSTNGWHCLDCNECYYIMEDDLCGICWRCANCTGGLCDSCGFCEECSESDNVHCAECGNCYSSYADCEMGYDHCEECCIICVQCADCLYEEGIDLCEDCGLCVYCCVDNAQSEGCDCGEYCIEGSDWYDHICPDCGNAFCAIEMCEECELCLDCCEGNSDCVDSPPLCVKDSVYDTHFCEDCGDCFHNSDICSGCELEGLLICESCCAIRLESEGCDCSDRCISDGDIKNHIASEHGDASPSYTATPQNSWEMDTNYHWRACRFCDSTNHYQNKAAHAYDKYGVCTVCKFDSQKNILILKQPVSAVAKVTDVHLAGEDDPQHPFNNRHTFTVAARGTSALTYQWYVKYGNGNWQKMKDQTQADSFAYVSGTKTNTLVVTVPSDGCVYEPSYKCVITDAKGNQETTNIVCLKIQHVYKKYVPSKGALTDTIFQPGTGNNIGVYESNGHYKICVGEECGAEKLEPHSFSKQTRIVYDSKSGERWVERTCTDCGFVGYILDHIHYFYDPDTNGCNIDTTYRNDTHHRLICLWPGCNKTTLEAHNEMGWQSLGTPYSNPDKIGVPYKECDICGYDTSKKLETYSESQGKMVESQWTQSNDLVFVQYGYASCDTVVNGSKLVIGFSASEYAKKELLKTNNPTVVGWRVYYYCDRTPTGSVIDVEITDDFAFERIGNELKWSLTVPLFANRKGGGIITFVPIVEECKHQGGSRILNASEPICTTDGYTGDTVCADCDGVILYGEVIESTGKHEGNLTLIPGTSKAGTCEQRGYEGTYRCDHCNQKVRGKSISKVHNGKTTLKNAVAVTCTEFGYSGDLYCECGVLLQEGELLAPRHTDLRLINADKASCMEKGYTGDWKCYDCNQIVKYGYNIAKGDHAWSKYGKVDDVYHRHTCVVAGCGAEEKSRHTDANRDLICDGCGYSWGSDTLQIYDIVFNIDIPAIGAKPDYTPFNGAAFASEGNASPSRNGVKWFDVTDNKYLISGAVGHEFKEGHVYRVTIDFRTKGDYTFAPEGVLQATINGKEAKIEYVNYETFAGISYTFEALKHQHTMTRVNKVPATCTTAGKQTYYHCTSCSKYFEDSRGIRQIANLSTWGNVAALGHVESDLRSNSTHHFKVCTRCYQEVAGSKAEHSGGTATCVQKAKCSICGTSYGNYADHNMATDVWGYIDTKGHAYLCLIEGCYYRGEILSHRSSGPATETEDETCLDCGYVITKAQNHVHKPLPGYQFDDNSHWQVCGCGEVLNKQDHVDANGDEKCDLCNSQGNPANTEPGVNPGTDPGTNNPGQTGNSDENGKDLIWLWILLAVVVVAGGGFAIYWFVFKKKENDKNAK